MSRNPVDATLGASTITGGSSLGHTQRQTCQDTQPSFFDLCLLDVEVDVLSPEVLLALLVEFGREQVFRHFDMRRVSIAIILFCQSAVLHTRVYGYMVPRFDPDENAGRNVMVCYHLFLRFALSPSLPWPIFHGMWFFSWPLRVVFSVCYHSEKWHHDSSLDCLYTHGRSNFTLKTLITLPSLPGLFPLCYHYHEKKVKNIQNRKKIT